MRGLLERVLVCGRRAAARVVHMLVGLLLACCWHNGMRWHAGVLQGLWCRFFVCWRIRAASGVHVQCGLRLVDHQLGRLRGVDWVLRDVCRGLLVRRRQCAARALHLPSWLLFGSGCRHHVLFGRVLHGVRSRQLVRWWRRPADPVHMQRGVRVHELDVGRVHGDKGDLRDLPGRELVVSWWRGPAIDVPKWL